MLTLQILKEMLPDTILATGTMMDNEDGLFMNNTGRELRWVAVRGYIHDWCIYCHYSEYDVEYIKRCGDKVCDKRNIKRLVKCDDEAFKMYRY
jgi:hypothetical protein